MTTTFPRCSLSCVWGRPAPCVLSLDCDQWWVEKSRLTEHPDQCSSSYSISPATPAGRDSRWPSLDLQAILSRYPCFYLSVLFLNYVSICHLSLFSFFLPKYLSSMSMYLIYPYMCVCLCLPIYLSGQSAHPRVCPPMCVFMYLSICLSIHSCIHLAIHTSI